MAFIDIENVSDKNIAKLKINLNNSEYEIISANSINLVMEFNIKCDVYEIKELNLIQDFYGIKNTYKYDKKTINIENKTNEKLLTKNISDKVLIDNINQLFSTDIYLNIIKKEKYNGLIKYTANAEVTYLFNTFDNKYIDVLNVDFEFDFETLEDYEKIDLKIANSNFIILPDSTVDSKIEIDIYNSQNEYIKLDIIDNISEDNKMDFNYHSVVIYFVQKGDTLWKIAKKFRSTVDKIVKINNIEDENKISIGQKLYIPKAV